VRVFCRMASQWRHGFAGPESLDFSALPVVAKAVGVPITENLLANLDIMAGAAKQAMRAKR
jgi:hypothetical protein